MTPRRPAAQTERRELDVVMAISLGGMLGASARYGLTRWLPVHAGHFPWATFWANTVGSLLLAFLVVVLRERFSKSRRLGPFATTGVIGAFTTMSTLQIETVLLVADGHATIGVVYAAVTLLSGLLLAGVGVVAGQSVAGTRGATTAERDRQVIP